MCLLNYTCYTKCNSCTSLTDLFWRLLSSGCGFLWSLLYATEFSGAHYIYIHTYTIYTYIYNELFHMRRSFLWFTAVLWLKTMSLMTSWKTQQTVFAHLQACFVLKCLNLEMKFVLKSTMLACVSGTSCVSFANWSLSTPGSNCSPSSRGGEHPVLAVLNNAVSHPLRVE